MNYNQKTAITKKITKFPNLIACILKLALTGTCIFHTVKPVLNGHSQKDQKLLNAGLKYCRMLQGEHSAILLTFIKLPIVIKIFDLSIFEWPFYTGFTVG